MDQLVGLYKQVKIGDPLEKGTLVGPVHTRSSVENFQKGISTIKSQVRMFVFQRLMLYSIFCKLLLEMGSGHFHFLVEFFTGYSDHQGGKILTGGSVLESEGNFVQPTIVEISPDAPVVKEELFGPVLYVMKFQTLEEAFALNNSVPQGLSSSIFTRRPEAIFRWIG